jgi:hypothetical protein
MTLYTLILADSRLVPVVLGGRCRLGLSRDGAPIWVEAALTPEERRQRKRMAPVAKQLRAAGVKTRWRGAVLEELGQPQGRGRKGWRQVALPPPPEGGATQEGAAGQGGPV